MKKKIFWVVNPSFSKKRTVSQKVRGTFKKALVRPLKTLRIVPLHCSSSLLVVCRTRIWLENSQTLTMRARPPLKDLSLLLTVQVCVVPLGSSSVFCSHSLTHAAAASCSIWTPDDAHFRIPYSMYCHMFCLCSNFHCKITVI